MLKRAFAAAGVLIVGGGPALAQDLPPLPEEISAHGALRLGVRCDQPPYGFKDSSGNFAGVEVEMARKIAEWAFGSPDKADMICVTAENRIPQLTAGKVDLLIATLGQTAERERVIDYSTPYNWGGSDILLPADSTVSSLADIGEAAPVVMLKGTTQAAWFEAEKPDVETLRLNTISDALQALKQRRAGSMAADIATLLVIAEKDKTVKMLNEPFAITNGGIGLRKNEPEWKAYINAALARMAEEGLYKEWIEEWVPQEKWPLYKAQFAFPPDLSAIQ